jgi:CRP/FNR family transcriptional regulator, cyclic AMP receptor protein
VTTRGFLEAHRHPPDQPVVAGPVISLLDADPDLAEGVPPEGMKRAREALTTSTREVAAGPFSLGRTDLGDSIGLLLLTGVLMRETTAVETYAGELLGPGDVIVPTADIAGDGIVSSRVQWTALSPTRLACLDAGLIAGTSGWPETLETIVRRMAQRSARQAVVQAICHSPRVDARLRGFLWHLADRWGRVTPAGVVLPLRLTHEALARLVGAQRPTVSTALKGLALSGEIVRRRDGAWVLRPESQDRLNRMAGRESSGAKPVVEIIADAYDVEPTR